jgi:hypothetical protein
VGRWTEAELALVRDVMLSLKDVSERTGRPLQTVARYRQLRGIQSIKVNREWTAAELVLLGDRSLPLAEVAQRTGRTLGACRRKADLLGTGKRVGMVGRAAEFSPEEDALLQELNWQVPLTVMAQALKHSGASVGKRLHRLGLRDGFPTGAQHHWWSDGASQNPAYGWRGDDWAEVRATVLERDGFTCQDGGEFVPSGEGLIVHHVIPWRLRPVNDPEWLATLCVSHHMRRPEHYWAEIPENVVTQLEACRFKGGEQPSRAASLPL